MNLSYWEIQTWLSNVDFAIVGSGIVGLSCALELRKKYPSAKIIILEKGTLPQGASTKNAGFACFGSLSEIIEDLKQHSEQEVYNLIEQRIEGLKLLRETLGDSSIGYKEYGGYELFFNEDRALYENCIDQLEHINALLQPLFNDQVFSLTENQFNFENILSSYVFNQFEGQIDTGKMMAALLSKAYSQNIAILNHCQVIQFSEDSSCVHIRTTDFDFKAKQLLIATNGFAQQLTREEVTPARAQVLITSPIPDLKIKGTFHLDRGYYYFRNIDNRILFGGGRQLDFKAEETTKFGTTALIQEQLEKLLADTILPGVNFKIDYRWSGIMGVGNQKKPILKSYGTRIHCGVRLGGMGVAIGSSVGRELASLAI